jgi:dihydroflavonol-4-reductase
MPSTTLVTGATGFLGSQLARRLCARRERVRALVRTSSDRRRIADLPLEYALGDVTDRDAVERALDGVTRVFHVAALYEFGPRDPARMEATNVGGTHNVLEGAHRRSIPSVYVSSVVALGPTPTAPVDEAHWNPTPARSHYERTKRAAHEAARALLAQGASLRIALPVTIYGPDDPSMVGRFHRLVAHRGLPLAAMPEVTMSFVHVDDCAAGLVQIADRGRDGEEYILCGQTVPFRAWFGTLARLSGRKPPRYLPRWLVRGGAPIAGLFSPLVGIPRAAVREGLAMSSAVHWAFRADKASRELGFRPRALDEGLAEALAWYKAQPAAARAAGAGA